MPDVRLLQATVCVPDHPLYRYRGRQEFLLQVLHECVSEGVEMPVADHPVHDRVRFKEVPLSLCHSSLPDRSRPQYPVLETRFYLGVPRKVVTWINDFHDGLCKQPDNSLPECRGCEWPERIRNGAR
jgi:hypothetical protein